MTITNAKQEPKVYYGLHFCPGVAEYKEPEVNNGQPYRIFIGEETIKNMNPSFQGKPVYVRHVQEVDLDNLQAQADGYVVESFYNKSDGKTWAKFIIVSDKGHEAIRMGWKLSNAYIPKSMSGGGLWHGVEYLKEIVNAEYEHLAIVPNPRYDESVILTPEEFKKYNSEKEIELTRLSNEKGESDMKFNFFSRKKVDNSADFETMIVELPKSKLEKTVAQIINECDEMEVEKKNAEEKKDEPIYANGDHKVKVGEEEMTVNELIAKHMEFKKNAEEHVGREALAKEAAEKKANEEKLAKEAEEKKANEEKEKIEKEKLEKKQNADAILNAGNNEKEITIELSEDRIARGKTRYGSGK